VVERLKYRFRQGLYFLKLIKLASNQSLFDFMRLCSKGFTENDFAEEGYDDKTKQPYFSLNYYPTLRKQSDGSEVELVIGFDRRGDKISAISPFFSSNVLTKADFLKLHHVKCWRGS
jgi:hypothetical protein